jgi:hypothetical protein
MQVLKTTNRSQTCQVGYSCEQKSRKLGNKMKEFLVRKA